MGVIKPLKNELFAQALAAGMTQEAAYADAGYKPNAGGASRLASKVKIINRVAELNARKVNRVVLSKQYVLELNIENAEKAIGRRPVKLTKMVKVEDQYLQQEVDVYVYEPAAANQAIKMLGTEIGMYTDRKELKITNEYSGMTDKELAQKLIEIGQQALLEGPVIEHDEGETVEESGDDGQ